VPTANNDVEELGILVHVLTPVGMVRSNGVIVPGPDVVNVANTSANDTADNVNMAIAIKTTKTENLFINYSSFLILQFIGLMI
jgi:hypothetical protein